MATAKTVACGVHEVERTAEHAAASSERRAKATAVTEPSAKLSVFLLRSSAAAAFPSPPCSFASLPSDHLEQ